VGPTDTLSKIAQARLGDASRYSEIFDLNKGKAQGDGGRLTDPDVLQVGWVLDLPDGHSTPPAAPVAPVEKASLVAQAPQHPTASPAGHQAVGSNGAKDIARSVVPSGQFGCFDSIITHESGWDVHATNPSSGAYGLPQSLPGSKMASAGADWHDNAATQVKWALDYMNNRYGSPCDAWSFWQGHHWY
jgi:hypothetical protein